MNVCVCISFGALIDFEKVRCVLVVWLNFFGGDGVFVFCLVFLLKNVQSNQDGEKEWFSFNILLIEMKETFYKYQTTSSVHDDDIEYDSNNVNSDWNLLEEI